MDEQDVRQHIRRRRGGRIWAGLFLLLVGGVLLLDQMNVPLPDYLFNWKILLIALGIFVGLRHNFRGGGWLILMIVGSVFLAQDYYPDYHLHRFLWPGILMVVGLMFIVRPHHGRHRWRGQCGEDWRDDWDRHRMEWRQKRGGPNPQTGGNPGGNPGTREFGGNPDPHEYGGNPAPHEFGGRNESYTSEDFVDATSIFGGVHKKVVSKNFRGGDITTVMGGTELDLSQADFTGTARLDITQIMGGTKIIVPSSWEVRSGGVTALFAGFEDKRQQPTISNPEKVLIIDGTSIFGGIELKNF